MSDHSRIFSGNTHTDCVHSVVANPQLMLDEFPQSRHDDGPNKDSLDLNWILEMPSQTVLNRFRSSEQPEDRHLTPGTTLLHVACWLGDEHAVKQMLEHGADVAWMDENFMTPLHWACQYG